MLVFFTLLGIITTIGIISFSFKTKNLIRLKINTERYNSIITPNRGSQNLKIKCKCEKCGVNLETDSLFCYECGCRLNRYL